MDYGLAKLRGRYGTLKPPMTSFGVHPDAAQKTPRQTIV